MKFEPDKMSNKEKVGLAVFNSFVVALLALAIVWLLSSCRSVRIVEKEIIKTDTVNTTKLRIDSIYINDSLLTKGIMPDTIVCLDINRFADEHALMVVNNQTDSATPFNLDKKGSKIKLLKKDNEIIIEETPRTF